MARISAKVPKPAKLSSTALVMCRKSRTFIRTSAGVNISSLSGGCGVSRHLLESKVDELLRLFVLWEDRHSSLAGYSKGMRQKFS
jgi:ABC-type multidrug transport system ATPase subunit